MRISFIDTSMENYGANETTKYYYNLCKNNGHEVFYNIIDETIEFYIIGMMYAEQEEKLKQFLKPKKYVYIEHSIEIFLSSKDWLRSYVMPNSKKNFFFSPRRRAHICNALANRYKQLAKENYEYLVVPVDYDLFKRDESIERENNLNVFVGWIHSNKGVNDILKIADTVPNEKFLFIGQGGGDIDVNIFTNGHPNCQYIGHVDKKDLPKYYSRAKKLYMLPTNGAVESASRVVFEAVLCGCEPVVNINVGNASYPWFQDREKIIENINKSNENFLKIISE